MKHGFSRIGHIIGAAALLAAGVVSPALAAGGPSDYDAHVPCGAFQRSGSGSWTAVAPVTLHVQGGPISIAPGQSFAPNTTVGGVAVPVILDRHCGNL
ncbi:MAG TPA: hypothetical protein VHW90_00530 [Stellaceae bacterium]|jgi:hypothetical protein|nr:hypothetical protein [Stellaceae bacterium]